MRQGRLRVLCLLATDLFTLYGIGFLCTWGYRAIGLGHHYDLGDYLALWPVGIAYVSANIVFRLYQGEFFRPAAPIPPDEELRRIFFSALLTHVGLIAWLAFARQTTVGYSRAIIATAGLLTAILAQPVRDLVRSILKRFSWGTVPVAIIGPQDRVARLSEILTGDDYVGFRIAAKFDEEDDEVVSRCRTENVRILVSCSDQGVFRHRLEEFLPWFSYLEHVQSVETLPVAGAHVVSFEGLGALEMVNQRRFVFLRAEKWLLDALLSCLASVFLVPVAIFVALGVKLTSRGPVLYRHARLGQNGRPLRVWKFRSMYEDADARLEALLSADPEKRAEWEANFKLSDDPRVTPFGRFLRKTSLDEIPQLLNVFSGEMSLIGPRPIVEAEVAHYGKDYAVFSSVRPGITGLWQATGRSDLDYARRVALDVHYVLNWSPWLDLWILIRTFFAVLGMRGAC